MMFAKPWIVAVCCVVGLAAGAAAVPGTSAVLDILKKNGTPADVWLPKTAISADFTCDGKPDILIRGTRGAVAIVALLPGKDSAFGKPDIIEAHVWNLKSVRLSKEEQVCEEEDGERLEGCKPARGCWNFRVEADSTDSSHCWWNQHRHRIDCWMR